MAAEGSNVQHIAELSVDLSPAYKALEEFGTRVSEASVTISQMFQNGWNIQSTLADVSNNGGDAQQRLAAEALKANEELKKQLSIITQNAQRTDTLTGSLTKLVGGYKALQLGKKAFTEIYDTMKTVESSMVDIKRVMELTGEETTALRDTLFSTAQAFGSTFDQAAGVTLKFAQAGYNAADAAEATKAALLAMNTAELDLNSATTGLIAILKQWGLEATDLVGIIDKLNYTADNNAVTTQDLVDGLAASSAVARAAGIDFEDLTAIITVMAETSGRSGKEIGNAFKSILSFIQREKSLDFFDSAGIKVFADESKDALLPMVEILQNMSEAWVGFTTAQQDAMAQQAEDAGLLSEEMARATGSMEEYAAYVDATEAATDRLNTAESRALAQQAAGTYRRSLYIALLENFADVTEISAAMLDAEGHSMRENADRMETLETKVNQLVTALQELAVQAGDAGLLDIAKWAVEAATAITNFTKSLGGLQPVLLTIYGLWMALNQQKAAKIFDMTGVTGATKALKSFADNLRILYYESETAGGGMKGFSAAMQLAGAEAKVAGGNIASAFAGLGVTGWIGVAVAAIGAVVMAVKAYNEHIQKTIDQANEAKEAYERFAKAGQDNINTLKSMEKEFEKLSKGVSENGENI